MNKKDTQDFSNDMSMSEPRVYEVGYHVMPTVSEGDLSNERDALVALITKFKGLVISESQPQLIDLEYDMTKTINNKNKHFSQAYFGWIKFDVSPSAIEALTAEVDAMESLIRFIMIKTVRENTLTSSEPFKLARVSSQDEEEEEEVIETAEETTEESTEEVVEETTDADDLTKIEGIGPKIAEVLEANGIKSFEDLSASKVGDLRTILADNDLASHEPKTWSKQATLAKNGKWDKLAELQEELDGGK